MRILVAAAQGKWRTGGAENYAWDVVHHLKGKHEAALLVLGDADEIQEDEIDGIHVISCPQKNVARIRNLSTSSPLTKALWHYLDAYNPRMVPLLRSIFQRFQPDILHTHKIDGFSHAIFRVAKRSGIPAIHTLHDFAAICPYAIFTCPFRSWGPCPDLPLPCRVYKAAKQWAMGSGPALVLSPSRHLADTHAEFGIFRQSRIEHLPLGVPRPPAPPDQRQENSFQITYIGGLTLQKGVRVLLDSWARIDPSEGMKLVIAGEGPLRQEIENLAGKNPSIRYRGKVPGSVITDILYESHVLVLPSIWRENHPLVLVEAAMAGVPLIASSIGGIPEMVLDGKSGILVPPGNAQALSEAMIRLHHNREEWNTMHREALKISSRWDAGLHFSRLEEFYREVAAAGA
ncbi:MAG TPA: glycosyltransferase family 4 protein [Thermoanaerobaculia bacterium]|nr:glycosyltransferase family 4 protein [Thermoanaerobaculia bacterium]HUM28520.1 glycosyltransferase family 4 protein [Thermoanaerobaculia bacterium]HXK66872.1 glycosyltransferase family 4 protein [Thermoanaerobaculia bacterium]